MRAGLELRKLSLEDKIAFLRGDVDAEGPVISRAEPRDKQDIVRLLKEDGEVGFTLCCTVVFLPKVDLKFLGRFHGKDCFLPKPDSQNLEIFLGKVI